MNEIKELINLAQDVKLIYAEDDENLHGQVLKYLKKIFPNVFSAKNGKEALEEFEKDNYDLIITDILMPEVDGIELSRRIKERDNQKDIIVVSAYSESSYFIDLINIGIDNFVLKPIDFKSFNLTLFKVLKKIKNEKENREYQRSLELKVEEKIKELKESYFTDSLTGFGNRTKIVNDLKKEEELAIIILNIDNFSSINLLFGYSFGDELLVKVSKLLEENLVEKASLYRLSSDIFAFTLPKFSEKMALSFARKLDNFFKSKEIELGKIKETVSFSMGVDVGKGVSLLNNAEVAINYSKLTGKNRIELYDKSNKYEEIQKEKIRTIHTIEKGIKEGSFVPFFQPIIDNKTGEVAKYEALARLKKDEEIIMPYKFIEPATESGLIDSITKMIIDKSFEKCREASQEISINISTKDLYNPNFIQFLEYKVEKYGINPNRVVLEILESVSSSESNELSDTFLKLHELGFKLSIDDFGCDNSNFSRLLKLDVDYLKIDGQFIKDLPHDENSRKITEAIVSFAKSINAKTVAEFVHSKEVYDYIKELGIDYSQGYYFSPATEELVESVEGKDE